MTARMTDARVFKAAPGVDYRKFRQHASLHPDVTMERRGREPVVNIVQGLVYHSPDGFEWGYGGSGPSDLSLNILAHFVPEPEAWRLHRDFTEDVISRVPFEGGRISAARVMDWIRNQWSLEP